MKRYIKEIIVSLLQIFMFYVFPLFAGPTDAMGMVVLIILSTLFLSFVIGVLSNNALKYLYPIVTAVVFIPSVFIYYNESALIHSIWYLAVSVVGVLIGSGINAIVCRLKQRKK
ncbi:MAG: hypothetical protein IJN38_01315 [Clostridia bacterium]|nr:hypothetical protein [Clostridia bacterium]